MQAGRGARILLFNPPASAAAQGAAAQPSARLLEAVRLHAGVGVPRDQPRACGIAEQLGAEADGMAASMAADCFYKGEGRVQDYIQSRRWYERAITLGWVEANCALGNEYFDGNGVVQDSAQPPTLRHCRRGRQRQRPGRHRPTLPARPRPAALLRQCAALAHPRGGSGPGERRRRPRQDVRAGDGVARDPEAAMRWWALAVRRGKMRVAYDLAVLSTNRLREPVPDDATRLRFQAAAAYWAGLAMRVEPEGQRRVGAALLRVQAFNGLPGETQAHITDSVSRLPRSLCADPGR